MTTEETQTSGLLQPGQIIRPMVKSDDVPAIVSKLYGLTVINVKELNSYDDKNFFIQVASDIQNPHIADLSPHGYVLKILNSMDTKNEKLVNAQNEMMLFLQSRGFNVPRPEKNIHGTHMFAENLNISFDTFVENNVTEEPSGTYMVRLLTFLPGKILHQVPYTPKLFYESGSFLGRMDNELKEFQNEDLKKRKLIWMLDNTPELSKFVYAVRNEEHHKIILDILQAWNSEVKPIIPKLKRGFIHGDFNEQNIIVTSDTDEEKEYHVSGIIDFGDIQYSCYVFEVAIAIMYMMVEVKMMKSNDVGGHVLAGYLKERDIEDCEWDILKECVAARFAQSLVLGAYSIEQDPENKYLIVTAGRGWRVLTEFWNTPKEDIIKNWKEIIHTYKR